jgi:hypothetical protein
MKSIKIFVALGIFSSSLAQAGGWVTLTSHQNRARLIQVLHHLAKPIDLATDPEPLPLSTETAKSAVNTKLRDFNGKLLNIFISDSKNGFDATWYDANNGEGLAQAAAACVGKESVLDSYLEGLQENLQDVDKQTKEITEKRNGLASMETKLKAPFQEALEGKDVTIGNRVGNLSVLEVVRPNLAICEENLKTLEGLRSRTLLQIRAAKAALEFVDAQ